MRAFALNCTLKPGDSPSSTDLVLSQVLGELAVEGVQGEMIRAVDHDIKPGVTSDEGAGDVWPKIRRQILESDILVLGTPIWLGQPSSVCKRILERMDAFLGETDEKGRMVSYGKVAIVAVVGNEDGAHNVCACLYQALNDVGFTIPASAGTYWVGEAMQKVNYNDLDKVPDMTAKTNRMAARNAAHLARLLRGADYPGV